MINHTPKPWVVCDNIHPEIHIVGADNRVICRGIYPDGKGVGRKNAEIMAASPELLEALIDIYQYHNADVNDSREWNLYIDAKSKAEKILKKLKLWPLQTRGEW